jgi:hypothetical protein
MVTMAHTVSAKESVGRALVDLIRAEPPDPGKIRAFLDALAPAERVEAISSLGGPTLQRRLYVATQDAPRVTLDDLVPATAPPLREIIFHGKNSLPAFTRFQKRLCRPPTAHALDQLWGYNHQSFAWATGPGYFIVREDTDAGVALDYREIPPDHPQGWPPVRANDRGLSRFVYMNLVDYLRRVSQDVFIGSAYRRGQELGNYFVISRQS